MRTVRAFANGLALLGGNLLGLVAGLAVFNASGARDQFLVQFPVAVVVSVAVFLTWSAAVRFAAPSALALRRKMDYVASWVAALAWAPLVFIPLHFFTQGYHTAGSNIYALWLFQVIVNTVACLAAARLFRRRDRSGAERTVQA